MKFTDIDSALKWIMGQRSGGVHFTQFQQTMAELHDPQDDFKLIHVAGTNGKGSFVAYLSAALSALGYQVGTLQSPHYLTHLDRIRLNSQNIPADIFLSILNEYYDFFMAHACNMFEMDYIIMCLYFKRAKVDYALIEVGMGGRLDSTNVVHKPLLSVITTIGLDHLKELGNTKLKIAKEKAGIIKEGGKVLIGALDADVAALIKTIAEDRHNEFYQLQSYEDLGNCRFLYRDKEYELSSCAKYQLHNVSLVLEALHILKLDQDYPKIYAALKKGHWPGRYEIIAHDPLVIIDGAHNEDGIKALLTSLKTIDMRKGILFSAITTKDYDTMIKLLLASGNELVLTDFKHPQNFDAASIAQQYHLKYYPDYRAGFAYLKATYPCVVVCGSLYFLSEFVADRQKRGSGHE